MSQLPKNDIVGPNCMLEDFNNPETNAFEAGPVMAMGKVHENRRIVIKDIPVKLQRHAIENLLKTFGILTDFNIPNNQETFKQHKPGFMIAFAEFSTFSEVEKAMREINNSKNKGFSIRIEFAHERKNAEDEPIKQAVRKPEPTEVWDDSETLLEKERVEQLGPMPLTVTYDTEPNDVFERVTAFNRVRPATSYKTNRLAEMYKKLVKESKGSYDGKNECFTFNEEILNMVPEYKCVECKNEGLLQCDETSLIYCSIKCSLITDERNNDKVLSIPYGDEIKLNKKVVICGIINEKCVYVRSSESDFGYLQNQIYKLTKNAAKLIEFPEVGDFVVVKSFDETCRAKVLDISDEDGYVISLQLIDYGSTARVFFEDLMEMSQDVLKLKCITHKLLLKDVKLEAINTNIIEYMMKLQSDKTELTVTELIGNEAVLVSKPSTISVNQNIMNLSVVEAIDFSDAGVFFTDYSFEPIPSCGPQKKVFVVNSSVIDESFIACISEDEVKDLREIYKAINLFGNSLKSKTTGLPVSNDQVCLVFVNDQWHRGIKEKSIGDGFPQFLLFDLFCSKKVSIKDVIPMPKAFRLPPPLTQICRIENFDDENVKKLAKKTIKDGEMLVIKGMKKIDGEMVLTI